MCPKKEQDVSETSEMDTDSDSDISSESEAEPEVEDLAESEDEVIKAIKRECTRQSDHPPTITCEDFVTDISFHPHNNILAVATIVGDVLLYEYSNEENTLKG